MKKVSIIMGVYNCKDIRRLRASIDSIIGQTYTDWEFLICNDGSTDETLSELKKIEQIDERIRVISYFPNRGLAYALNQCILLAEGQYIARQDDDDISEPERLACQVKFMDAHPEYSVVGTAAKVFDDNGIWGKYEVEEQPTKKTFLWNSPFIHPTVMMRKDALKEAGCYRVAKETRRCEDYDLFMRMYAMNNIGYNIQSELYQYRIENGNKKYRPMKYRIDEAIVRYIGFKRMGMFPGAIPYVIKPILIGLIPQSIFKKIRRQQYNRNDTKG